MEDSFSQIYSGTYARYSIYTGLAVLRIFEEVMYARMICDNISALGGNMTLTIFCNVNDDYIGHRSP